LYQANKSEAQTYKTLCSLQYGVFPYAGLIVSSNTLYGTTIYSSSDGYGSVFAVNTDGTGLTNLVDFTLIGQINNDGAMPYGGLVLSSNTLYGTGNIGGSSGNGAVFAVNTDGTGLTNLHSFTANSGPSTGVFTNSTGAYPKASLILSGNILYGTTANGGSAGNGTVFAINTNGFGFTNLYSFSAFGHNNNINNDGAWPASSLILYGNTLYGTTVSGGSSGNGTVFAINTNGTAFSNFHNFTAISGSPGINSDGANPVGGLYLLGNTLYGTTIYGGSSGQGTIFTIITNGTSFTTLFSFYSQFGGNPGMPYGGLILSGSSLYGTTRNGGGGNGTVFGLNLAPAITTQPQNQTNPVASTAIFTVTTFGIPPLSYQWLFNSNNISGGDSSLYIENAQFTNAGNYQVIVTNVFGSVTSSVATLTVIPAAATVTLSNLTQTYDGTAIIVNVSTVPSGLNVILTYNGSSIAPTNIGVYTVVGTVNNANYFGSATNLLIIGLLPQISQQPYSLLWVNGVDATLNIQATGYPLPTYKWFFNGNLITNATSPTLTLDPLVTNMCGSYSCIASNIFTNVQTANVVVRLPGQAISVPTNSPANAPVITFDGLDPVAGMILRGDRTLVSMNTTYSGGSIFYTLDGSVPIPGANGIEYTGPFYLIDSTTINAVAWDSLFENSATALPISLVIRSLYAASSLCKGGGFASLITPAYSGNLFVSNTLVQVTATASNGWSILYWNGATNITTNASTRVVAPTTLEAVFGTPYTAITGGVGVGTVVATPDLLLYPFGSSLKLLAQPQSGSYFFRWQPSTQITNPLFLTVTNANTTNSAVFSPLLTGYVSLVLNVVGNGQATVSPLQGEYLNGTSVTLMATPNNQYSFVGWTGNVSSTNNPLTVNLKTNESIQAVFAPNIQVILNPVSKNVLAGTVVYLAVGASGPTPLTYQWCFNGNSISSASNYLFSIMSATAANAGNYNVVVSNGGISVTSQVASITISPLGTVVVWGNSPAGMPSPMTNSAAIAAGSAYALSLQNNTTIVGWGDNSEGQISIPYGLTNIIGISAGLDHSVALRNDGKLIAWGRNNYGQINIPLGLNQIVALSSGIQFTLALDVNGNITAWGRGDSGQTNVPVNLTNVVSIAAGDAFGLALQANGNVVGWGDNTYGQINIPANITNAIAIAAGSSHALALLNTGNVIAWGNNDEGQTNVTPGLSNVVALAAGLAHSIALEQNGTVTAWGQNNYGQLTYPAGLNKVAVIDAATNYSMALITIPPVILSANRYGTNMQFNWPSPAGAYSLYSADTLLNPTWNLVNLPVSVNGSVISITIPTTNSQEYFRLGAQ
jgi:uncharacterized repeat protein (TIGR03803 family)